MIVSLVVICLHDNGTVPFVPEIFIKPYFDLNSVNYLIYFTKDIYGLIVLRTAQIV